MQSTATTIADYCAQVPVDQADAFGQLRNTILKHLPKGFVECINYGMLGYVVAHEIYPAWYHCDPKLPLPFINLAAQKNSINLYHMWLYADPELLTRFQSSYSQHSSKKLDMGKSCIRFKYYHDIPYVLIGQLISKISVEQWIALYEQTLKK